MKHLFLSLLLVVALIRSLWADMPKDFASMNPEVRANIIVKAYELGNIPNKDQQLQDFMIQQQWGEDKTYIMADLNIHGEKDGPDQYKINSIKKLDQWKKSVGDVKKVNEIADIQLLSSSQGTVLYYNPLIADILADTKHKKSGNKSAQKRGVYALSMFGIKNFGYYDIKRALFSKDPTENSKITNDSQKLFLSFYKESKIPESVEGKDNIHKLFCFAIAFLNAFDEYYVKDESKPYTVPEEDRTIIKTTLKNFLENKKIKQIGTRDLDQFIERASQYASLFNFNEKLIGYQPINTDFFKTSYGITELEPWWADTKASLPNATEQYKKTKETLDKLFDNKNIDFLVNGDHSRKKEIEGIKKDLEKTKLNFSHRLYLISHKEFYYQPCQLVNALALTLEINPNFQKLDALQNIKTNAKNNQSNFYPLHETIEEYEKYLNDHINQVETLRQTVTPSITSLNNAITSIRMEVNNLLKLQFKGEDKLFLMIEDKLNTWVTNINKLKNIFSMDDLKIQIRNLENEAQSSFSIIATNDYTNMTDKKKDLRNVQSNKDSVFSKTTKRAKNEIQQALAGLKTLLPK